MENAEQKMMYVEYKNNTVEYYLGTKEIMCWYILQHV